jgi:hypothetical protein
MKLKTPVDVSVNIESPQVSRDAFYNLCFITENDTAPRTLIVEKLQDLLDNGYIRADYAYNFCYGVFAQRTLKSVTVRAKRSNESYIEAYEADDNSDYYFVVIEPKFMSEILSFNDYLVSNDEMKLQFFSINRNVTNQIRDKKIVYYYNNLQTYEDGVYEWDSNDLVEWDDNRLLGKEQDLDKNILNFYINRLYGVNSLPYISDGVGDYWDFDNRDTSLWDQEEPVTLQYHDFTEDQAQSARLAYPEGAWIARCCTKFPSLVQWLHKFIAKADAFLGTDIPDLSTTSSIVRRTKVTLGSGKTGEGVWINEQVSLDWVKWAIQRNVWKLLYTSEKVNATDEGLTLIENQTREVLDVAVQEGIFSEYKITERKLDRRNNKASLKFSARLMYSILDAEIEGTVYH